jgi:TetR/AcrR family transcriptional regulator, regulator of cefoperazone and chloramphenicol sensitivity
MKHKTPLAAPSRSATAVRRRTPSRQTPSARGDETRASLLAAGRAAFARRGFDGASVRDITRAAGANLGAVTYHFGSKRGLYVAVLLDGLTPMVDRVAQAAASHGTPVERLETVVEVFFDYMAAHPHIPRLMLQEVAAGKKPPTELVSLLQRNAGYVAGIVAEGMQDGTLRKGHPILTTISVVSQPIYMTVMAALLREVAGIDLADPAVRAMAAAHVKAFIREGLSCSREASA